MEKRKYVSVLDPLARPRMSAREKESASRWAIAAGVAGLVGALALLNYIGTPTKK